MHVQERPLAVPAAPAELLRAQPLALLPAGLGWWFIHSWLGPGESELITVSREPALVFPFLGFLLGHSLLKGLRKLASRPAFFALFCLS